MAGNDELKTTKEPISDDEFWELIRRAALSIVTAIERRYNLPLTVELVKVGRRALDQEERTKKRAALRAPAAYMTRYSSEPEKPAP